MDLENSSIWSTIGGKSWTNPSIFYNKYGISNISLYLEDKKPIYPNNISLIERTRRKQIFALQNCHTMNANNRFSVFIILVYLSFHTRMRRGLLKNCFQFASSALQKTYVHHCSRLEFWGSLNYTDPAPAMQRWDKTKKIKKEDLFFSLNFCG